MEHAAGEKPVPQGYCFDPASGYYFSQDTGTPDPAAPGPALALGACCSGCRPGVALAIAHPSARRGDLRIQLPSPLPSRNVLGSVVGRLPQLRDGQVVCVGRRGQHLSRMEVGQETPVVSKRNDDVLRVATISVSYERMDQCQAEKGGWPPIFSIGLGASGLGERQVLVLRADTIALGGRPRCGYHFKTACQECSPGGGAGSR